MTEFRDILGRELNVGDTVVFSVPYYHELSVARIHHFSKKMVSLDVCFQCGKCVPISECSSIYKPICRYPSDVVKVESEYVKD